MVYVGAGFLFWAVAAALAGQTVRSFRPARPDLPYLAVLAALLVFGTVLALLPEFNYTILVDDAYFFMQIARNVVETGTPSFDGVHITNGFNPLWLCMLAALSKALPVGKEGFVTVVQLASILLMGLSALQLHRLTSRFLGPLARVVVLVVWANPWAFYRHWLGGMETPALVFFTLAMLNLTLELELAAGQGWWHRAAAGAIGGLVMLARPDAAVLVAAVGALILSAGGVPWRTRLRATALFALAAALPVAAWLLHNRLLFGHFGSISAHVKLFVYGGTLAGRYDLFCLPLASLGSVGTSSLSTSIFLIIHPNHSLTASPNLSIFFFKL